MFLKLPFPLMYNLKEMACFNVVFTSLRFVKLPKPQVPLIYV